VVRNEIQDFASTRTIFANKFKLIILDECDAMTRDAQFALRRGALLIAVLPAAGPLWACQQVLAHHQL
jgi:hypothetical protein